MMYSIEVNKLTGDWVIVDAQTGEVKKEGNMEGGSPFIDLLMMVKKIIVTVEE